LLRKKIRLDKYLSENGLSESYDKAKKEIIAGWVKVNGETVREPGRIISGAEDIHIARPGGRYASRGGDKLEHGFKYFNISVKDKIVADLGASTGGFTDCLLKNGAAKVYSVDVGYGLLAHNLRTDPRVIVKERTNARSLTKEDFQEKIDFLTIDLSFISIQKLFKMLKKNFTQASGIILIKPQFEATQIEHEKGVVREKKYHINILHRVINSFIKNKILIKGLHFSPIKGPAGNIEFLLYFGINDHNENSISDDSEKIIENIVSIVNEAHNKLN